MNTIKNDSLLVSLLDSVKMNRLICAMMIGLIISLMSVSPASSETSTIRIKSIQESGSRITISGKYALFQTQTIIEVWDFVKNKKISSLTFEEFSRNIPEIDIEHAVPEGIKLSWRDKNEIKKMMEMNKKFLIQHISLSADGENVALNQIDGSVFLWNTSNGKITPSIPEGVRGTKFSYSGKFIGIHYKRGEKKSFSIIDTKKNKELISMPSDTGMSGFFEFSQNEKNVYVGISNFVVGYELKTGKEIMKTKIPIEFYNEHIGSSAISVDEKFLACQDNWGVLLGLANEKKTDKLQSGKYFFLKDSLIIKIARDPNFKRIELSKIDKFIALPRHSKEGDSLFTSINIPPNKTGKLVEETIIDSTYYSFRMEGELAETVVYITKELF